MNNTQFFITLLLGLLTGIYLGYMLTSPARQSYKRRLAKIINKCFKDVDWEGNHFIYGNNVEMENRKGEKVFYGVKSIDEAISKLNRVLRYLHGD